LGFEFGRYWVLLLFFLLFLLIGGQIKSKFYRSLFSFASALFLLLQSASLYFSNSFINYQFLVHFNLEDIQGMIGLFLMQIVVANFFFFFLFFLIKNSDKLIKKVFGTLLKNKLTSYALALVCLIGIGCNRHFIDETKSFLYLILPIEKTEFQSLIYQNGFESYVSPENVKSKAGKNIIILSLESLERSFLGGKFSQLTPNLQRLKKKWNYIDLEQNYGSEWTSGALYTCLTGFPAYFGTGGNSIFQEVNQSRVTSITHALKKSGYELIFMNGNADYSGTSDMLKTLEFDRFVDLNSVDKNQYPLSHYGLRDKDLFELAKKEVHQLTEKSEPYTLFISTTDTHNPRGYYDERMEEFIDLDVTQLEFMIAAVDHMVGDFVSYLESNNLLENTTIFIMPDHLKMGDPSMFHEEKERGLYVISNSDLKTSTTDPSNNLYQIDLPNIILNSSDVDHNVKFLSEFISRFILF